MAGPFKHFGTMPEGEARQWMEAGVVVQIPEVRDVLEPAMQCMGRPRGDGTGTAAGGVGGVGSREYRFTSHGAPLGEGSQCRSGLGSSNAKYTWCFTGEACCNVMINSKGALKTPPYLY